MPKNALKFVKKIVKIVQRRRFRPALTFGGCGTPLVVTHL